MWKNVEACVFYSYIFPIFPCFWRIAPSSYKSLLMEGPTGFPFILRDAVGLSMVTFRGHRMKSNESVSPLANGTLNSAKRESSGWGGDWHWYFCWNFLRWLWRPGKNERSCREPHTGRWPGIGSSYLQQSEDDCVLPWSLLVDLHWVSITLEPLECSVISLEEVSAMSWTFSWLLKGHILPGSPANSPYGWLDFHSSLTAYV